MATIKTPNNYLVYLYLTIALTAWGSMYVVSKYILELVPSFTVLFIRYFLSGTILLLFLKLRRTKPQKIERRDYKYILLIGIVGYFLSTGAQLLGTHLSSASLSSLINALNPIFIIIFAVPILKEKITLQKIVSVIATIVGVYIILGGPGQSGEGLGIVISFFSVVTWSLTSVVLRHVMQKYDTLIITTCGILVAVVCSLPIAAIELAAYPQALQALLDPYIICGLLYIGLICTAMAHMLWNKSLSMMEAGKCALFYPLQPMVSALLGVLFLNEKLDLSFVTGAAFILGGIIFSVVTNRSTVQHSPTE